MNYPIKIQYQNAPAFMNPSPGVWLDGTLVQRPGGIGVQKPNNKFLSVQPNGSFEERPDVGGSYEVMPPDPQINVLRVSPGTEVGQPVAYAIVYRRV